MRSELRGAAVLTIDCYSRIVHTIYNSAVEDGAWGVALEEIATALGATGSALVVERPGSKAIAHRSIGADPGCVVTYNQYYHRLDPSAVVFATLPAGRVVSLQQLHAADAMHSSEFYNDWSVPNGHGDFAVAVLTRRGPNSSWLVVTAEPRLHRFSTPERVQVLAAIVPHVQHAIAIRGRLSELDRRSSELGAAVEAASDGMVILGGDGRVSHLNPAAAAVFGDGDGLRLTAGILRASMSAVDSALARTVGAALGRDGVATAGRVAVPRPSGRPAYVVRVVPVSAADAPTALVVVVDPHRQLLPTAEMLRCKYGLTWTEAEVARRVLDGAGLRTIAEGRSVSITTIRTHLKHIFEKTGTHRQAELIRVVLGAPTAS